MSTVEQVTATLPAPKARRQSLWRAVLRTSEGKIGIGLGVVHDRAHRHRPASSGPPRTTTSPLPARARRRRTGSAPTPWVATCSAASFTAARTVLLIPLVAVTLSLIIGGSLGLFGAYWGGWPDVVISKVFDVILTLPPLLIVLVIIGGLGSSDTVLIITVALVYAPGMGRVVRGTAQSVIVNPYVLSAQARGERDLSIIFREVLPNVTGPTLAEFGLRLTYGILFVATLSFLGLGVQPPASDWGLDGGGEPRPDHGGAVGHDASGARHHRAGRRAQSQRRRPLQGPRRRRPEPAGRDMSAAPSAAGRDSAGRAPAPRRASSADGAALVVEDLSVGYHQKDGGVLRVVANVDLKLFPGQVLGLAGESGCGKSTAALAAVGYRHPGGVILSGRSTLGDIELLEMRPSDLRLLWGGQVAYISQNAGMSLNPALTIAPALRRGAATSRGPARRRGHGARAGAADVRAAARSQGRRCCATRTS